MPQYGRSVFVVGLITPDLPHGDPEAVRQRRQIRRGYAKGVATSGPELVGTVSRSAYGNLFVKASGNID